MSQQSMKSTYITLVDLRWISKYKRRFTVQITSPSDYSLRIHNVRVSDSGVSGLYHCVEASGFGAIHTIQLIVSPVDKLRFLKNSTFTIKRIESHNYDIIEI